MSEIEFHEITLDDKTWMDARFQEDDRNACEYTFANNFVWRKVYHVEVAEKYGCAIIRFEEEGVVMYSYPIGAGDRRKVIDELIEICREEERPLIMSPLSEADREQMITFIPEKNWQHLREKRCMARGIILRDLRMMMTGATRN